MIHSQGTKIIWSDDYLSKLEIELGDECIFLCLSPISFRMLADMAHMLKWSTRYESGIVSRHGLTAWRELNVPCLTELNQTLSELRQWMENNSNEGDCGVDIEQLRQIISEEIEAMSVIVNNNLGCGCGCGGGSSDQLPPEDYETPNPITDNTPTPITEDGINWKCNASHYLIYSLRLTMMKAVEWQGSYANWQAGWDLLFSFYQDPNARLFSYQPYTAMLALLRGVPSTQLVTAVLDPAYNDLVCAIYSAQNSQEASNNVMTLLREIFPDYVLRQLATEIASQLPFDLPFTPQDLSELPITHQNGDCTSCGENNFDWPDEVADYEWRVGTLEETVTNPYTTSLELKDDGWRYDFSIPASATNWSPQVVASPPTLSAGEEIVGMTYLIIETATSGGVNDPNNGSVRVAGHDELGTYRYLWWLTGHNVIQGASVFNGTNEENGAQIIGDRGFDHYARVGTGQTPPGTGHALVSAVLWCIKLA